jgi:hypothetical protein
VCRLGCLLCGTGLLTRAVLVGGFVEVELLADAVAGWWRSMMTEWMGWMDGMDERMNCMPQYE